MHNNNNNKKDLWKTDLDPKSGKKIILHVYTTRGRNTQLQEKMLCTQTIETEPVEMNSSQWKKKKKNNKF